MFLIAGQGALGCCFDILERRLLAPMDNGSVRGRMFKKPVQKAQDCRVAGRTAEECEAA
jgi:hypothetical protein